VTRSGRLGVDLLSSLWAEPHHPTDRSAPVPPSSGRTGSFWFTKLVVFSGRPLTPASRPLQKGGPLCGGVVGSHDTSPPVTRQFLVTSLLMPATGLPCPPQRSLIPGSPACSGVPARPHRPRPSDDGSRACCGAAPRNQSPGSADRRPRQESFAASTPQR